MAKSSKLDSLELSSDIRSKIREVLPSDDALDSCDFDAVSYINELFPDEHSLLESGQLALTVRKLKNEAAQLDIRLSRTVQQAAFERAKTARSVHETSSYVHELFEKISQIREKALESEKMVEEICADIRRLDNGKQNLLASISTLQKLHMLVNCVAQLKEAARHCNYERVPQLIHALNDFFEYFSDFMNVPQLAKLKSEMTVARLSISDAVYQEFQRFDSRSSGAHSEDADEERALDRRQRLSQGCAVIDAMGNSERRSFYEFWTRKELQAYGAIYGKDSEYYSLNFLEKRFEWLRNQLLKYNEVGFAEVFPLHWNMTGRICLEWCSVTSSHLSDVMKTQSTLSQLDLDELISSLEKCVVFESELQRLYAESKPEEIQAELRKLKEALGDDDENTLKQKELDHTMTASDVRKKYAVKEIKERIEALKAKYEESGGSPKSSGDSGLNFVGSLSGCFQSYLHFYVDLERKNIEQILAEIESTENWTMKGGISDVTSDARLMGIDNLLAYMRKSIDRCAKIDSTRQVFAQIAKEYISGLNAYASLLIKHLPALNKSEDNPSASRSSFHARMAATLGSDDGSAGGTRLTMNGLLVCCLIVNTANYIKDIIPGLESRVRATLAGPDGEESKQDGSDLSSLNDQFEEVSAKASSTISNGISKNVWLVFEKEMSGSRKWAEMERSDDESSYMSLAKSVIRNECATFHQLVLDVNSYPFVDISIAKQVLHSFVRGLDRIRQVNSAGGHQLQIDLTVLKSCLLNDLPHYGFNDADAELTGLNEILHRDLTSVRIKVRRSYGNQVNQAVSQIESLLKTLAIAVMDKPEMLADTFESVTETSDGKKGNAQDLARLCDMRGLSRRERDSVLSYYNRKVGAAAQKKPLISGSATKDDFIGRLTRLSLFSSN